MISIKFEIETVYGKYVDALWLPEDHTFTDSEIETMKQDRVTDWIATVEQMSTDVTTNG